MKSNWSMSDLIGRYWPTSFAKSNISKRGKTNSVFQNEKWIYLRFVLSFEWSCIIHLLGCTSIYITTIERTQTDEHHWFTSRSLSVIGGYRLMTLWPVTLPLFHSSLPRIFNHLFRNWPFVPDVNTNNRRETESDSIEFSSLNLFWSKPKIDYSLEETRYFIV